MERSKILELPGRLNHEEIGTLLSDSAPYTLNRSYKWPPFILQASCESKNRSCKIYGSINKLRLCQDYGRNFISK